MFQKHDKEVNRFNGIIFGHQFISRHVSTIKYQIVVSKISLKNIPEKYSRQIKKLTRVIMRMKLTRREERTKRWRREAKLRTREAIAAVRTPKDILLGL